MYVAIANKMKCKNTFGSTFGSATDITGFEASDTDGGSQIYEKHFQSSHYIKRNWEKLTELWKGLYVLTTLRSVVGL